MTHVTITIEVNYLPTGTVKWFSVRRNYGFIERETGADVFVHGSEVEGYKLLCEGNNVSFDIEETPKGFKAKNVVVN